MRVRVKPKRNVGIRGKIYTAGQEIDLGASYIITAGSSYGLMSWSDATNVNVIQGSGGTLSVFDKTTGANTNITQADWTIYVTAGA